MGSDIKEGSLKFKGLPVNFKELRAIVGNMSE